MNQHHLLSYFER